MTNSTEAYWSVDGVSLQTFAFNITSLGGDREAPPPVRGDNTRVPFAPGTKWQPKVEDERVLTLGMWVLGADEDGTIPDDEDARRTYDRNWRMLRRLLYRSPRKQFTLTKRFWVETADLEAGGVDTSMLTKRGDWALYQADATVSYFGGLNPTRQGQARGSFTVDLLLSDPFFYSAEIEVPFTTAPADEDNAGPEQTIQVLGDGWTTWIEIDFEGPLTAPQIDNLSEADELFVRYATEVDDGESATVRVHNFSATHFPTGDPFKTSGYVQHEGHKFWLYMEPGETDLELSAQAGTGVATLRYKPRWW